MMIQTTHDHTLTLYLSEKLLQAGLGGTANDCSAMRLMNFACIGSIADFVSSHTDINKVSPAT